METVLPIVLFFVNQHDFLMRESFPLDPMPFTMG